MTRILLATKGNGNCQKAEEYALACCRETSATLNVVHIVESSYSHYGYHDSLATEGDRDAFVTYSLRMDRVMASQRLKRVLLRADELSLPCDSYVGWGDPVRGILVQAMQLNPDIIIVGGTHGGSIFSIYSRLQRKVACTVKQIHGS